MTLAFGISAMPSTQRRSITMKTGATSIPHYRVFRRSATCRMRTRSKTLEPEGIHNIFGLRRLADRSPYSLRPAAIAVRR